MYTRKRTFLKWFYIAYRYKNVDIICKMYTYNKIMIHFFKSYSPLVVVFRYLFKRSFLNGREVIKKKLIN